MDQFNPPKFWLRFFKWFCKTDLHLFIEGDLLELYQERIEKLGKKKADRRFSLDVLFLFRPSMIRKPGFLNNLNTLDMLKHNWLISWRSFKKDKTTFLINLLGLSTGLACVLLIFLWVQNELAMDKFHEKGDQLYQVMQELTMPDGIKVVDWTPGPLAETLKEELPEIEYASAVKLTPGAFDGILTYDDLHLRATPQYVDKDYFEIFSYPLLHGDKNQALFDKYATIVSEELALKLFSSTEAAVGKSIKWENKGGGNVDYGGEFTISGVFKNIPSTASEHFDLIFTYEFFFGTVNNIGDWNNDPMATYLVLEEGTNIEALDEKITALVSTKREEKNGFFLRKNASKYLHGNYENGIQAGGRIAYVHLFSIIALLILLIASINFMNLSTARASIRIKEIGVKKTMGASRRNLIFQFVNESLFISFFALLIAVVLVALLLPQFNQITGKSLQLGFNFNLIASFLGITLITGLLSSSYPALYLSSFNPIQVLQGKLKASFGELWVRKGLVVFQFTISVILIVSVLVIYRQMDFIQSKNLGYDREHILSMQNNDALDGQLETFLAEVKKLPEVQNASSSSNKLVGNESWTDYLSWEGKPADEEFVINVLTTNYDFIETFDIKLAAGRSFSREFRADSATVVINEAAAKGMGLENPVGEIITFWGQKVKIVGVAENFQYQSLYSAVDPVIIRLPGRGGNIGNQIWIKIKASQEREAIKSIAGVYEQFNPGYPFEFGFVDEEFQALYESENNIATLSKYFAGLAILISCLGLFGLALFSVERRTKEISVRKVLGASAIEIISLLSSNYARMVAIALLIAMPLSYLIAQQWLGTFEFRIELKWWFFGLAAAATLLLAWISVSWQTIKAAQLNPVDGLRSE